jgi:hypothetical protein
MRARRGSSPGLIDQAGPRPRYLQDMRLQSGTLNVACQLRQVGREAQTVQVISYHLP